MYPNQCQPGPCCHRRRNCSFLFDSRQVTISTTATTSSDDDDDSFRASTSACTLRRHGSSSVTPLCCECKHTAGNSLCQSSVPADIYDGGPRTGYSSYTGSSVPSSQSCHGGTGPFHHCQCTPCHSSSPFTYWRHTHAHGPCVKGGEGRRKDKIKGTLQMLTTTTKEQHQGQTRYIHISIHHAAGPPVRE